MIYACFTCMCEREGEQLCAQIVSVDSSSPSLLDREPKPKMAKPCLTGPERSAVSRGDAPGMVGIDVVLWDLGKGLVGDG